MMTEIVVTGSVLADASGWVARLCPTKPTVPVLGGMLLDAAGDELRLTAYDYETAASVTIPAVVKTAGRMLVSGRLLAAVAKTVAKDVNVTICDTGGQVRVVCGKSEWTLPAMPVDEYPQIPGGETPVSEVQGGDLRSAVGRVLPAADRKGGLPVLGGVQLVAAGEVLTLTATDRFRLATVEIPWKPLGADLDAVVVPWSLLDDAVRGVHSSEPVRLGGSGRSFTIATDTHTLTGRTIGETFPAWQRLMPVGDPPAVAVLEAAGLARAAGQALVVLDAAKTLRLDFGPDGVGVSAAADSRSARAEAAVVSYEGEPMSIGVNPEFLKDALAAAESPLVKIQLGVSASRPVLIVPLVRDGEVPDPYRHLLMPVKLPPQT